MARLTLECTTPRQFDLNVVTVLDDWEVYRAIRDVIANTLDEQALTVMKELKNGSGFYSKFNNF